MDRHADNRSLIQSISGDDALPKNLQKLVAGRLDMIAEVGAVLDYTLAEQGLADKVELVPTDVENDIFIAFSPARATSQTYADQLREGVERLRANGRFAEIMGKYGQQMD